MSVLCNAVNVSSKSVLLNTLENGMRSVEEKVNCVVMPENTIETELLMQENHILKAAKIINISIACII